MLCVLTGGIHSHLTDTLNLPVSHHLHADPPLRLADQVYSKLSSAGWTGSLRDAQFIKLCPHLLLYALLSIGTQVTLGRLKCRFNSDFVSPTSCTAAAHVQP